MTAAVARFVATTVVLWGVGAASAQTVPYQGPERANIGSGLGQTELPHGTVFQPRVDAALQYVANMDLAANGQPQIDMAGLEVAPGFYGSHSTDSVNGAIDYSLIGRFWEDGDYDDVSHRLAANGQWIAVPEWFRIRAQALYDDTVIDPSRSVNLGGLGIFGPGNLMEVAAASVSPALQHRVNDLEFTAEYDYGRVWYLDEEKGQPVVGFVNSQDSTDQEARVRFGTFDQSARLVAKVLYDWQRSDFENALPYEYERAGLEAAFRFARTLSLVGDVGRESDLDASSSEGGLDADFWSLGLRWDPSDRTSAEARYGDRFFGESYSFRLSHRARFLEIEASHREEPTIETRVFSLGGFEPGELPPGLPEVGVGSINSTPFVSKESRIGMRAVGSRTTISIRGFRNDREYLRRPLGDETWTGVGLGATRQLASNLSTDLSLSYTDFETSVSLPSPGISGRETYYDSVVTLRLNRTSGSRLTLGGEAGYLSRAGDADYEGWWVALRTRWLF